jgi:hypothetical protein
MKGRKIQISRDSVSAGDGVVPHDRTIDIADASDRGALLAQVMAVYPLPRIARGKVNRCLPQVRPESRFGAGVTLARATG